MKRFSTIIFSVLFLITTQEPLCAQKEYNIWYFGYGAGIDFNSGVPVALTNGQTDNWEGTSSISDPISGTLLFYTDGVTIWDRNHRSMPNGSGLLGANSSTQAALIVPLPDNPKIYYLFTTSQVEGDGISSIGASYSIVDMTLNGGLGDITTKNRPLLKPSAEKLQAVRHCNGRDYWVLMHRWGTDEFLAYLLTPLGLSATPVISSTGPKLSLPNSAAGYLMASSDGQRLGMATHSQNQVALFDFDNSTGTVSNPVVITSGDQGYGIGFSPDASKLYVSVINGLVLQYDLASNDPTTIISSRTVIHDARNTNEVGGFQIGPDGRLYLARSQQAWIAVINEPNLAGKACGYINNGVSLAGSKSGLGLPNNITAPSPELRHIIEAGADRTICRGDTTQLAATGGGGYIWAPVTGLSCTNCPDPKASPDVTTTYHVSAIDAAGCIATDSVTVIVGVLPLISIPRYAICRGESTVISVRPEDTVGTFTYSWQPSTSLSCSNCPDPLANPTETTLYTVDVVRDGICRGRDTILVRVVDPGTLRTYIPNGLGIRAGGHLLVPIILEDPPGLVPVTSFRLSLRYDRGMLRLDSLALSGTLCSGWTIQEVINDVPNGTYSGRFVSPNGRGLIGADTLLQLGFLGYVRSSAESDVNYTIDIDDSLCTRITTRPGNIRLDSVCGLQSRLIESMPAAIRLDKPIPNPFNATADIGFSVPVDGPVLLVISDAHGREIECLVDGDLTSGEHSIRWDASSFPSGMYFCHLDVGGWQRIQMLFLLK